MSADASYAALWRKLCALMAEARFSIALKGRSVLRILLTDIGSPTFSDHAALKSFFCKLRTRLSTANVLVMLSVDDTLLTEEERDILMAIADAKFALDVPDAETKNAHALEERYDGRFFVEKLPLLNSIATHKPDCIDLVFEKHRRYFDIRILHLPAIMGGGNEVPKSACQKVLDSF